MNQCVFVCLLLSVLLYCIKGQSTEDTSPDDVVGNGFQPSLAVVLGIPSVMFSLTFILLTYAKLCHRNHPSLQTDVENRPRFLGSRSRRFSSSGIDRDIIESLPFFRFSSLGGTKEGLECAVCLSKFEDVEILRLLPKCKHAFHIDCIDQWLESHSSCPICRKKVSAEDPAHFTYSNSLRFLSNSNPSEAEDSNIELFVQREETQQGSSRFCIGSSFRKTEMGGDKDIDSLIGEEPKNGLDYDEKLLHRHYHKIIVSDVVFKHRWSSVSYSDLMFLNSKMLNAMSSNRFTSIESSGEQMSSRPTESTEEIQNIKEDFERKRLRDSKVDALQKVSLGPPSSSDAARKSSYTSRYNNPVEQRSMSEITAVSRFRDTGMTNRMLREKFSVRNKAKEARMSELWLPIARRTVQWFANREGSSNLKTQQVLDV